MKKISKIYLKLGQRLKYLREQRGLTQEQLAFEVGINRTYVGDIEQGKKRVSIEKLEGLARVLEVELRDLFTFEAT